MLGEFLQPANRVTSGKDSHFIEYRASWAGVVRHYLVPRDGDATAPILECLPIPAGDSLETTRTQCTAWVQYSDRLLLKYFLPRRSVDQWRDVDQQMRALVASFVVDCFEGPLLSQGDEPAASHPCEN